MKFRSILKRWIYFSILAIIISFPIASAYLSDSIKIIYGQSNGPKSQINNNQGTLSLPLTGVTGKPVTTKFPIPPSIASHPILPSNLKDVESSKSRVANFEKNFELSKQSSQHLMQIQKNKTLPSITFGLSSLPAGSASQVLINPSSVQNLALNKSIPSNSTISPKTSNVIPSHIIQQSLRSNLTSPGSPQTVVVGTGIEGINSGISGFYPPDPTVAVGKNHVVETVNNNIAIWTKNGHPITRNSLNNLFSPIMSAPNDQLSDPEIVYDSLSNHWFLSMLDFGQNGSPECTSNNNPNSCFVILAVSKTDNPAGDWWLYSFNWMNVLPDQPRMAANLDKVIISVNDYPPDNGRPGADVLAIDKNSLINGLSANFQKTGYLNNEFSIIPAKSLTPTSCSYLVSSGVYQNEVLRYSEVCGNPASGGVIFSIDKASINMAPSTAPSDAIQPANTGLDTGHGQISSVTYFNGKIWDAFNDRCTNMSTHQDADCIRVEEFAVNNVGSGLMIDKDIMATGADIYYPALSIDNQGHMKLLFSSSSGHEFPSLYLVDESYILNNDPNGIKILENGTSSVINVDPRTDTPRFGDYYDAAIDPITNSIWAVGEYGNTSNSPSWSTFIGSW